MNPYLKNQIETSSPEQILILLYDGAIKFLNQAKIGIQNKDIELTHNNLIKAQNIISELRDTLDMEIGGELANNLYSLYNYFNRRLVQANIKKEVEPVDEVLEHLRGLRDTWKQAIIKKREEDKLDAAGQKSQNDYYEV
ncbi:MAG: flagellar export chaperone FliS [Candidatus Melainabacteria bacterium LEY3_CP_29_8]|nr:MAG: flagellar export chaperone FliS [Candidatus Melainabacteria bacterium LEY3_CP_29_8]